MCPASNPGKGYCNYPGEYFCGYWGCETIASDWQAAGDKFLKVSWGPYGCTPPQKDSSGAFLGGWKGSCQFVHLNITEPTDPGWMVGRSWGFWYWEPGKDRGSVFTIKKGPVPADTQAVGPNPVIVRDLTARNLITDNQTTTPTTPPSGDSQFNTLWKLMEGVYKVLNATHPELTEHCWLCFDVRPPFYEAVGISEKARRLNGSNPPQCNWKDSRGKGMTLASITGRGRCIGRVPTHLEYLCETVTKAKREDTPAKWLVPAKKTKWICSKGGFTPCISLEIFDETSDYCIQVAVIPKIIYHPNEYMYNVQNIPEHHIQKREPLTALTVAVLMLAGGAGVGTGVASLVKQTKEFNSLRIAVDEDLERIEQSISALEKSVRSLSEVVLQNRRGLDLLFLQQGGLCAALREECCVYADHTGVVRDTMTKLKAGLEKRKREREAQQSWYETWFNHSPWLTTLLSTIAGPLILLVLGLTFGPCIFNKVIEIVKRRLEAAHLMLIKAKYETLPRDPEVEETLILAHQEIKRFDEQNDKIWNGGL
uniref:Envelope glycoprotein n=1 Tax=Taeniopygia guttata TaxID=59729 RepID=A0A674GR83_TAEGU